MLSAKNIDIKLYNDSMLPDLEAFIEEAAKQGIENNSSMEKLALRHNSGLFVIYHDDKIISMAHTHDFYDYYPKAWRVFARTATLKEYRSQGFGIRKGLVAGCGLTSWALPYMVDYAFEHGAEYILFTTNKGTGGGTSSSAKVDRHFHKVVHLDPVFSLYDEREIYTVNQSVWRLNYRDIQKIEGKI